MLQPIFISAHVYLRQPSETHRRTLTHRGHIPILLDYLVHYPLKTRKRISFLRWRRTFLLMEEGKHLNPAGLAQIKRWKKRSHGQLD
jgi:hypothetical protein